MALFAQSDYLYYVFSILTRLNIRILYTATEFLRATRLWAC